MPRAIYKGDRQTDTSYDNFTVGKEYEYTPSPDYDDDNELILTNDTGRAVRQLSIDFDFVD